MTANGAGFQEVAKERIGGRYWTRTSDILRVRQESTGCKGPVGLNLQDPKDSVTPDVTPESEIDPKKALLEAFRGVDRKSLLPVLADVLAGGGK